MHIIKYFFFTFPKFLKMVYHSYALYCAGLTLNKMELKMIKL